MTTQELAKRLIELVNEGKNLQAEEELYADDVVSYEQADIVARGKEAVMAKTKQAVEMFEAFHGGGVSTAYVGQDTLLLKFEMDVTPKGGERTQFEEFGFYRIADGKVVEEHFYAQPLA